MLIMKLSYTTMSLEVFGGKRCPVKIIVVYMIFIIGSREVYSNQGPPATCSQEEGCEFDSDMAMLNCQDLKMDTLPDQVCREVLYLDMRYNNLNKFSSRIHYNYPNLEKLDLGAAMITMITPKVFDKCNKLKLIYLDSNEITTLKRGTFEDLTSLELLYLSGNKIAHIKTTIFDPLNKTLKLLDISYNAIERIDDGSFEKLINLERLFLQHNQLKSFNSGLLRNLRSLTHLYLSNNNIRYIPHGAFHDVPNLKELKLGNNPELFSIYSGALNHLTQLSFLDLMHTKITTMRNISHLFSNDYRLKNFHISGTYLDCDESFYKWRQWYDGPENHPRKIAKCYHPHFIDLPPEKASEENRETTVSLLKQTTIESLQLSQYNSATSIKTRISFITAMTYLASKLI